MTNPYQPFFDKLDRTVDYLSDTRQDWDIRVVDDAAVLLRRAGFVLANLLNVNAQVLPTLILPVEGETVEAEAPENEGT